MKKYYSNIAILIAVIVLESLPIGYVLAWANFEGAPYLDYVAYFSMVAFGTANFAPGLCAFFTCVTLVLSAVAVFVKSHKLDMTVIVFSAIALLFSIFTLIRNIDYITTVSIVITALLLVNAGLTLIPIKKNKNQ